MLTATEYFRPRKIRHLTRAHAEEYAAFVLNQANPIIHYNSDTMKRRDEYDRMGIEITFEILQDITCRKWGISYDGLQIKTRKREIVEPRQFMHLMGHKFLGITQTVVGAKIGMVDHSSVCHSCRKVKVLYENNRKYREFIQGILPDIGLCEDNFKKLLVEDKNRLALK